LDNLINLLTSINMSTNLIPSNTVAIVQRKYYNQGCHSKGIFSKGTFQKILKYIKKLTSYM